MKIRLMAKEMFDKDFKRMLLKILYGKAKSDSEIAVAFSNIILDIRRKRLKIHQGYPVVLPLTEHFFRPVGTQHRLIGDPGTGCICKRLDGAGKQGACKNRIVRIGTEQVRVLKVRK